MSAPTDDCVHGLGPIEACVDCNGRAQRERAAAAERPSVFPARHASHCTGCNLPITIGQRIAWLPGHTVTHEDCWT